MANIFKPKRSNVPSSVPTLSNLVDGELAVNSADKKIYLRDGSSIIQISNNSESSGSISAGSANQVIYNNSSNIATGSTNLTFDGFDLNVHGHTIGRGSGALATNVAIGRSTLSSNTTGSNNTAIGYQSGSIITTGTNNTCIGYSANPSSSSVENEVTIGNNNVDKFRVPGAEIDIKRSTTIVATVSATTIDSFKISEYRSARIKVQVTQGTNYQVSEILLIHDGVTVSFVEYATIATGPILGSFSATITGENGILQISMESSVSSTIKVLSYRTTI